MAEQKPAQQCAYCGHTGADMEVINPAGNVACTDRIPCEVRQAANGADSPRLRLSALDDVLQQIANKLEAEEISPATAARAMREVGKQVYSVAQEIRD